MSLLDAMCDNEPRPDFESEVAKIREHQALAKYELLKVQMREWPDSKIVPLPDVLMEWMSEGDRVARSLALCLQHPVGIFYECGKLHHGGYKWRGFRYGVEPREYISGFGRW